MDIQNKLQNKAWLIFVLVASFCAYEYALRTMIGPLTHEIAAHYQVGAQGVGLLASAFFLGYAPVQILAGSLFKRFGLKTVFLGALLLSIIGTACFAITNHFYLGLTFRLLIGVGSGFAFLGSYVFIANWFPPRLWALLYGCIQLLGCLGALYGQLFFAKLSSHLPWQQLSLILVCIGLALYFYSHKYLQTYPNKPTESLEPKVIPIWHNLKIVIRNKQSWYLAGYAFLSWGPITISASLWGPAYIGSRLDISIVQATHLIAAIWLGVGLGSPFIGWLSGRFKIQSSLLLLCAGIGLIATTLLLTPGFQHKTLTLLCLLMLGFATAAQPIIFVRTQSENPKSVAATAIGFTNLCVILSGVILQPLSSLLMIYYAGTQPSASQDFIPGLILMPLCYLGCAFIVLFLLNKDLRDVSGRNLRRVHRPSPA